MSDDTNRPGLTIRDIVGCEGCADSLTLADRLSLIADLVSGLPHGPGTPGPGLELGESVEAYELLTEALIDGAPGLDRPNENYVSVRINGLWFGASKPKTEGK